MSKDSLLFLLEYDELFSELKSSATTYYINEQKWRDLDDELIKLRKREEILKKRMNKIIYEKKEISEENRAHNMFSDRWERQIDDLPPLSDKSITLLKEFFDKFEKQVLAEYQVEQTYKKELTKKK